MRMISVLLGAAVLASCTTAPPEPMRTAEKQREYIQELTGKVALAPTSCVPHYSANDMRIIDDDTVMFRDGSSRVYVAHLGGGCSGLGSGHYALLTRHFGSPDLCRGDIAQVVDTANGMTMGSCAISQVTPFVRPHA